MEDTYDAEIPISDYDLPILYDPDIDFDYLSQIRAIRTLLSRQDHQEAELIDEIKRVEGIAQSSAGAANQHAVDVLSELIHESFYQDVAHSMAAVGMLAPLIETIFRAVFKCIGAPWPRGDIAKNIVKCIEGDGSGIKQHMPTTLETTLEALFTYRNRMFHFGFEWPSEERRKFNKSLSQWPHDWFNAVTSGGEPWMFYMSSIYIIHCLDLAEDVLEGLDCLELWGPPHLACSPNKTFPSSTGDQVQVRHL